MENKNQKSLEIPEGFELDLENSSKDKIILKEKVISWNDFGQVEGWYIESCSVVRESGAESAYDENKNTFPSKEEAEAALALSQLLQWRNKYRNGWIPDFKSPETKYAIKPYKDRIDVLHVYSIHYVLTFKTYDKAYNFLEKHKKLIEQAKPLL